MTRPRWPSHRLRTVLPRRGDGLSAGMASRSSLDAALVYASAGWAVLPVAGMAAGECGCRRSCGNPAKHPLTRHGLHDATTDAILIREWWRRSPSANVGIATGGPSGLVVVDVDLPRGGEESLRTLRATGHRLPRTLEVLTGGGGLHLFYAHPGGVRVSNTAGRLPGVGEALPGIDLRGDGGYVVVPPSVHASGLRYQWNPGPIVALPAWARPPVGPLPRSLGEKAPPVAGASAYGSAALARQVESVRGLPVGQRNDGLNRAAFSLGRLVGGGELSERLVHEALLAAALATGLGERESERTIRSGLSAGKAVPRRAPGTQDRSPRNRKGDR